MGPTWVLSAPDGSHVGPMNFAIRVYSFFMQINTLMRNYLYDALSPLNISTHLIISVNYLTSQHVSKSVLWIFYFVVANAWSTGKCMQFGEISYVFHNKDHRIKYPIQPPLRVIIRIFSWRNKLYSVKMTNGEQRTYYYLSFKCQETPRYSHQVEWHVIISVNDLTDIYHSLDSLN